MVAPGTGGSGEGSELPNDDGLDAELSDILSGIDENDDSICEKGVSATGVIGNLYVTSFARVNGWSRTVSSGDSLVRYYRRSISGYSIDIACS